MRFFLPAHRWHKGLDWYADRFAEAGEAVAVGEASNGYARGFEHPGVPERVAEILPDIRLIYLVRDPIARLVSHYRHRLATGREWRAPEIAIDADPAYVETGRYGAELVRWARAFPADRILVLRSEHLFASPTSHLARVAAHIGVREMPQIPFESRNRSDKRKSVPRPLRRAVDATGLYGAGRALGRVTRVVPGLRITTDEAVQLPPNRLRWLGEVYREDRQLLRRFVPADQCDWSLP